MGLKMKEGEYIFTAFAQEERGPGWASTPIYVIIADKGGEMRCETIQPEDQTPEMSLLYRLNEAAHKAMVRAVKSA